MQTLQNSQSIYDIIQKIDNGELVLPEFQRDFKWQLEKSEILFDSIFRGLFIGSLIISKPKFDLVCRGFDTRPRGSKARKPSRNSYTKNDFEDNQIYTLLDGQQRVTSLYRSFKGHDNIYIIFKEIDVLKQPEFYDATSEDINATFEDYILGFDSVKPENNKIFSIKISSLYDFFSKSEKQFTNNILKPILQSLDYSDDDQNIYINYAIKLFSDFKTDILKKDLLSVQLLDMDLEKFCLYFERSNSQGLNLSFSDIITAKIYLQFNLRTAVDKAIKENNEYFSENLVDPLIRYINFKDHQEVTKKSILEKLKGESFINHWDDAVQDIVTVQKWLESSNWVFQVEKIPYKTMLLPLLSFFQNLPHKDFSQASEVQLQSLMLWFYASIFDNRYGGARHGSTNVVIKKDCEILKKLAIEGRISDLIYWDNFRINYSEEEFLRIDSKSNTKFLALNYLMWNEERFKNLENSHPISIKSDIDVHHIFPSNYIKAKYGENSDQYDKCDSILNKIRINKISNIKIKDKSPSIYLKEILDLRTKHYDDNDPKKALALQDENNNLIKSLQSHAIPNPDKLINGNDEIDENHTNDEKHFNLFLKQRYVLLSKYLKKLEDAHINIKANLDNIW